MNWFERIRRVPKVQEVSATKRRQIESAQDPMIKDSKLSMLSKPNRVTIVVPDLSASDVDLAALGLQKERGKWYVSNRNYFPDPVNKNSVIINYGVNEDGTIDLGFCSQEEFKETYADPVQYAQGKIVYLNPIDIPKGKPIGAIKCSTGEFTLVPEGTPVRTNEGNVVVKPGKVLVVNEKKNSIYVVDIAKILEIYIADPMNPASMRAFALLQAFQDSKGAKSREELSRLFHGLVEKYNAIPRNIKRHEAYSAAYPIETLRDEYQHAAEIVRDLDYEIAAQINSLNFDERIKQARRVVGEIRRKTELSAEEREIQISYILAKLLPKTNNHQHLKGSVPVDTLLALAQRHNFTEKQVYQIRDAYTLGGRGFTSLNEFNRLYGIIGSAVRTPEDYQDAVKGIIEEATREGQLTVEIRCSVIGQKDAAGNPLDPHDATENILQAMQNTCNAIGKEAPKIGFTFLGYRARDWTPEEVMEHARLAVEFAQKYPKRKFSFDIAGPEDTGYSPSYFSKAFALIREYNKRIASGKLQGESIGLTIHAGETPTYDNGKPGNKAVEEALDLGVNRIGHGVQAITNANTLNRLAKSGVTVEICGVCNISTIPTNTQGMAIHPVEEFINRGIPVTICTDNDAIAGTNITKEYALFLLTGHKELMNWNNIKAVAKNGIRTSFISEKDKKSALNEYERRIRIIERLIVGEQLGIATT